MVITKISKGYKITIPHIIRRELNISEVDNIEWIINEDMNIELIPHKKKSMMDLIGIISDEKLDAVESCEKASRGEF
ncbi:MAG: hypothetical protein BZ137_00860 [Methanosphaera sp. rholeuAM130]|nr:MAG: hypothetical protein BZ137_00860 [Methanosphaera sp. rholeuAM130]